MKSIAIGSVLLVTSLSSMASACPLCRDSVAIGSGGGVNPSGGLFNASVLCILGAFLLALSFLIFKIARAIRLVNRQISI